MLTSACAGTTITSSPTGTDSIGTGGNLDAFFSPGIVDFSATAAGGSGLSFVGWSEDLTGTTNPLPFSLQNQTIGFASFNTSGINAPLAITSFTPATVTITNSAVDVTVNGTGFTTNPNITFTYLLDKNGFFQFRNSTLVSSTQLVIHLNAGHLSAAGFYQLVVLNVASARNPEAFGTLPVANSAGPPELGIAKSHTGTFAQGQQNATYTVLLTNNGTRSTIAPVTVTETARGGNVGIDVGDWLDLRHYRTARGPMHSRQVSVIRRLR